MADGHGDDRPHKRHADGRRALCLASRVRTRSRPPTKRCRSSPVKSLRPIDLVSKRTACGRSPSASRSWEIDRGLDSSERGGPRPHPHTEFVRIRATLATAATAMSEDIPAYDPQAMIDETRPIEAPDDINTAIYGAEVEGEVSIRQAAIAHEPCPAPGISDQIAGRVRPPHARRRVFARAIRRCGPGLRADRRHLAPESASARPLSASVAENVTMVSKSHPRARGRSGHERILTVPRTDQDRGPPPKNGSTPTSDRQVTGVLTNVMPTRPPPRARGSVSSSARRGRRPS